MNIQSRIVAVLRASGKPLSFEKIYSALEADGKPMPKDKPKLQVRQTLYKKDCFDVQKGGLFYLKDDAVMEEPETAVSSQQEPQPAKPTEAASKKTPEGPKVKDRVIKILQRSDKPMSFEDIYSALEKDGFALPKSKPKLKVRQILYKADYFGVEKGGLFSVNDGVEAEEFEPTAPTLTSEPKTVEKPEAPAQPVPVHKAAVVKLKDRIIMILKQSGKPLSFQKVYEALESDGHPMPKSKPKLKVRQTLYNAEHFTVEKGGLFSLADGVEAGSEQDETADNVQSEAQTAVVPPADNPVEAPAVSAINTSELVAQAREEALIAAREAAAQAREETIREARESAKLAAQEAAAEVAREAALEATRIAEEAEQTKRMAIEAAVEAARNAALDAAREAAKIALSETTQAVAEAAAEEAKRISGNQDAAGQSAAAIDPIDQELLDAARAAREAVAKASAAVDNSLDMNTGITAPPPPANMSKTTAPAPKKGTSIRERTVRAINSAGRPLSLEEIMIELGKDGNPLPMHNAEQVVQRVVDNVNNFQQVEPGLYSVAGA